jgi:hypothetical protein
MKIPDQYPAASIMFKDSALLTYHQPLRPTSAATAVQQEMHTAAKQQNKAKRYVSDSTSLADSKSLAD